ncbi:hypothetical protein LINPERHAP1_LOCUS19606, partial [Linum perenne]
PRRLGGLGVPDLRILNTALLSKWHWRFTLERSTWWRKLIVQKCGVGPSEWRPSWQFRTAGLSVWKWLIPYGLTFWTYGSIDPGGSCSFWFDFWVKGRVLVSEFPRIAAAAQFPEASVSNVFPFADRRRLYIPLRFQLRGGALEEWYRLILLLASIPRNRFAEGPAFVNWPPQPNGVFTVSSLRRILVARNFIGFVDFPFDVIWKAGVPSKFACLSWKIYLGRVATQDNLQQRGMVLANRCVLCGTKEESVQHLFLSCAFASEVWTLVSSKLSIHGPHPSSMVGFIQGWKGLNCLQSFHSAKRAILHAVLWYIWSERNNRIFKDVISSSASTTIKLWIALGDWLSVDGIFTPSDLMAWRRLVFENG